MGKTPATVHSAVNAAPNSLAVLFSALVGGAAGGVAWCFLSVWSPWPAQFWLVPIAIGLAAFARWQGYRHCSAMACTVFATCIAFVYAQYLFGAVRIADSMGLSLREALFKAGFSLTADIAWANLRGADWIALALALLAGMGATAVGTRNAGKS